ncbi:MAG TPA: ParA family protein [Longimicrobiaceae bacterium]|jgi:chromosome partitioning protein|nr:ParA family protein [Longimicrobiaceae bacterium]
MSHVIAIANQKGGVGKTTTAINLGASLAAAELRTLIIDLDPQGNTTSGLGVDPYEQSASLYSVLLDMAPLGMAISRSVHLPLLDVVPTTTDLAGAEVELPEMPEWQLRLRGALSGLRGLYDYVLLDCSPSFSVLTLNALSAADSVLVPVQAEYFALEGLSQFTDLMRVVRQHLNPGLRVEGVLLTMVDQRLGLTRQVTDEVRKHFGAELLQTVIPRNVTLAEAPGFGKPVLTYRIDSVGAQAYLALAREIIGRTRAPGMPRRAVG